jgi:hypothetical protein
VPYTTPTSRATYPSDTSIGDITDSRLKTVTFGVFAQSTYNTAWSGHTKSTPFNFMWNQQVLWDGTLATPAWTYEPVKYWPNDNNPADNAGATGSLTNSYLSFFAYAPYVEATNLPATGHNDATADGIVELSANNTNADASYIYYRTSNDAPFDPNESVDLLWATAQDLYKTDATGYGHVDGKVQLTFKHALSKVGIYVKAMIDRTDSYSSDAYSTEVDANTRIFIESATLTTPDFYSEGKLMIAPNATVPTWDFTDLSAKMKTGLSFDNDASNAVPDVRYAFRYAAPNIPMDRTITDSDSDGIDDVTGLTLAETVKEDFDAMEAGVTSTEQQLAANQEEFIFPPAGTSKALTVNLVYRVVTYDPNLVLNNPKLYSVVQNNITATLASSFAWEAGKKYKILLEPGLTSAKFTLAEITAWGEVIILSSVVKEWDTVTKEVDVH